MTNNVKVLARYALASIYADVDHQVDETFIAVRALDKARRELTALADEMDDIDREMTEHLDAVVTLIEEMVKATDRGTVYEIDTDYYQGLDEQMMFEDLAKTEYVDVYDSINFIA